MKALKAYGFTTQSPHAYFQDALILSQSKQIPEALQAMDAAIVFSQHCPFYIYQKIRLLFQLGAYKSCSHFIVTQLEYIYKHASLYLLCRSLKYLQIMNHYPTSVLKELLTKHHIPYVLALSYDELLTSRKKTFLQLAKKAMFQDDYTLCLCYCNLHEKVYGTSDTIIHMKAYAYHRLGNLSAANLYYLEQLKRNPKDPSSHIQHGLISMELGAYQTAIHAFQEAHALNPLDLEALSFLGECYYVSQKFDLAISTYLNLTKRDNTNPQYYFNLSHTYEKINKKRLSRYYLKQAKKQIRTKR